MGYIQLGLWLIVGRSGGLEYSRSGGNQDKSSQAKTTIFARFEDLLLTLQSSEKTLIFFFSMLK